MEVEPGVTWMVLEERLRERGIGPMVYPRSAPRSTVGGWLADNGLGVGSFEYGWLLATKMISTLVEATSVRAGGEERGLDRPGSPPYRRGPRIRPQAPRGGRRARDGTCPCRRTLFQRSLPASNVRVTTKITHLGDAPGTRCLLLWRCAMRRTARPSRSEKKTCAIWRRLTVCASSGRRLVGRR